VTEIKRLIKNRFVIGTIATSFVLVFISLLVILLSILGKPERLFPFAEISPASLGDSEVIKGWADFDKNSYQIGELASLRIRLLWRSDQVNPDIEMFKNGIGFFPFSRREIIEQQTLIENSVNEYLLEFILQTVDVVPASSYQLAPPTVYFTTADDSNGELHAYRINAPQVHIGDYFPPNVSKIPLLDFKGEIDDPVRLRQGILVLIGSLILILAIYMAWQFGRVRTNESLSEPERLWREFHALIYDPNEIRDYLLRCEWIFTHLLMARLQMSPVTFWLGREPDDDIWKDTVNKARDIFSQNYLVDEPDQSAVEEINTLLDHLFSQLIEEERLKMEKVPSFTARLIQQPTVLCICATLILFASLVFVTAAQPMVWRSNDIVVYNNTIKLLRSDEMVEKKYEQISNLVEQVTDDKIKAAALYNAGTFSATPELIGQDIYQQEALLEVMFQEQRVFLDALLHSLSMEDPFLLVAMIRDSIRFLTQGVAALKAAVRILPDDEAIRRNLELVQKRRNAYAETIQELLREGEEAEGMGELQRQTLMDLEQFMQMEMPDEYAELEEGKDDKDYFILEGF